MQIYVDTFGLEEHFCFNSQVTALDRPEGVRWLMNLMTGPGMQCVSSHDQVSRLLGLMLDIDSYMRNHTICGVG